jgi:hypothetical protein
MTTDAASRLTRQAQGFDLHALRNEGIELEVAPELGAKVVSLKNLRTGRDWFAPATGLKLFRNRRGDDFATSPLLGWDECLPTVAACRWEGRELPDHGEVWSAPWRVEAHEAHKLRTSLSLPLSPFKFTRTLLLQGHVLAATYSLGNLSDRPEKFLWAMHPLITPRVGDRIELKAEARRQLIGAPWLDTLDFGARAPACAKVFARNLTEGHAAVVNDRTGDRLALEWNAVEMGALGIWLTRGGWNGCHHLALEPTTTAADSLAVAAAEGQCGIIAPRSTRTWSVRLHLEP